MRPALAYWVDRLDPFLIHFTGRFGIRYYGLGFAAGFIVGAWLLARYWSKGRSLLPAAKISDFMVSAVLGVVLGGRIGSYFLYDGWRNFGEDHFGIFKVWDGGMSFHGGLLGVIVAVAWYARSEKIPLVHLFDLLATAAPAGIFFVRIANFINGELWGHVSTVPWAVIFPRSADPGTPVELIAPRHPSQLYEAGMEGALLFTYMQLRFWKSDAVRERPGRLAGEFLVAYALARITGEVFREPDASLIMGVSRGTFYSLFMIAVGLFMIFRKQPPLPVAAP
ncbi:MAG TPA: prolipoprotein diacylglyceryl transferase [Opitutaceae bacterium]|jgi:phosphatidylglycerol:prolipoprotein diacylglycerol transferase|nr:prolipoprotein diacylglyceryl transferase [Opitutaceae bacterium]